MTAKQELGAFYTTQVDEVLSEFTAYPKDRKIIDLYAGDGALLNWGKANGCSSTLGYDVSFDAEGADIIQDTLMNVPTIPKDSLLVVNPPYLLRNRASNKNPFILHKAQDLYKCSLLSLADSGATEVIAIVPYNMVVDQDDSFRRRFYSQWGIDKLVVFDKRVFNDTNVRVCAFHAIRGETTSILGHRLSNTRMGFDFYESLKPDSSIKVGRLLIGQEPTSSLVLRATDTGTPGGEIALTLEVSPYFGKQTDRNKASITLNVNLTLADQAVVAREFNSRLQGHREQYDSLFLTNFLAGKDGVMRKRIAFKQAFSLINTIIKEII